MLHTYNPFLVFTSLVISFAAAWLALEFSSRVHAQTSLRRRAVWLLLGSCVLGMGIWAMHYVGMLAFQVPFPMLYDWPTVVVSLFAAVASSGIALYLVSRPVMRLWQLVFGSLCMGGGIAGMHYIGMAAMRMPCETHYQAPLVILSVVLAVVICCVALRICYAARADRDLWSLKRLSSALLMGAAIPSMHYIGMAALRMEPMHDAMAVQTGSNVVHVGSLGTICLVIGALIIMALAVFLSALNRRALSQEEQIAQQSREQSELDQYQRRLLQAFSGLGVGAWECDPATGLFVADAALRSMFEIPEETAAIPRELWRSRVHPDDHVELDRRWRAALLESSSYENEYRVLRTDRGYCRFRTVATIERDKDGNAQRVVGMTWDVTAEHEQRRALLDERERFQRTLEAVGDAVISVNESGAIDYVNPAAAALFALQPDECTGKPLMQVLTTEDENTGKARTNPVTRCREQGGRLFCEDGVLVNHLGRRYNISKQVTLLENDHAVITIQDITAQRTAARALEFAATHDALTELPNRAAFDARLQQLWNGERNNGRVHCLCLLDLDRFKIINDTSGHLAGDALLKQVVRLLRQHLNSGDMLARMGGDEFLFLFQDTNSNRVRVWAQRVLAALERMRFEWQGKPYAVTASIGVVEFDENTASRESLISEADIAMFTAKHNGRNQMGVYQDGGAVLKEMETLGELRLALEQQRFELHAQPIVPVHNTGDQSYFELLVRMRDASGGLVPPAVFIPAAEKYGVMRDLDRWIIRHALESYSRHPFLGDLRFSINLSGQSLSHPELWPFVYEEFRRTAVPPQTITFEVTETGLIENMETAEAFLQQARRLGCRVALDDFGSGLSSLGYLKRFTLDYLKLDGSFVKQMCSSKLDQAIVRSAAQIAHTMNAVSIGECAEDAATVEKLGELGVNLVQGWATGKPRLLQEVLQEHAQQARPAVRRQEQAVPELLSVPTGVTRLAFA